VVIRFVIDAHGAVASSVVAESTYPVAAVGTCIAAVFHRLSFPSPEGGGIVTVNYPVTLSMQE
jgi:hypothetical protein